MSVLPLRAPSRRRRRFPTSRLVKLTGSWKWKILNKSFERFQIELKIRTTVDLLIAKLVCV